MASINNLFYQVIEALKYFYLVSIIMVKQGKDQAILNQYYLQGYMNQAGDLEQWCSDQFCF